MEVIYKQRRQVLDGEDLKDVHPDHARTPCISRRMCRPTCGKPGTWTPRAARRLRAQFRGLFLRPDELQLTDEELQGTTPTGLSPTCFTSRPQDSLRPARRQEIGRARSMRELERVHACCAVVDEYWMDHIDAMTELRQGIGLRAYGQSDPVVAYKQKATRCSRR
ncbi:MAG: hypothetical protein ACLRWQ_16885 [Flavonifractor plautii]